MLFTIPIQVFGNKLYLLPIFISFFALPEFGNSHYFSTSPVYRIPNAKTLIKKSSTFHNYLFFFDSAFYLCQYNKNGNIVLQIINLLNFVSYWILNSIISAIQ